MKLPSFKRSDVSPGDRIPRGAIVVVAIHDDQDPPRRREPRRVAAQPRWQLGQQVELALVGARDVWEWSWTALVLALNGLVLVYAVLGLSMRRGFRELLFKAFERRAGTLLLCSGFIGAVLSLQLVFDPRYREFPSCAALLPALIFTLRPAASARAEAWLLTAVMIIGIPCQLWQEGLANTQALGWAAVSALLALALFRGARTSLSSANNSANTPAVTV